MFSRIRSDRRASWRVAFFAASVLALSACNDRASNEESSRQVNAAVDKTEKAAAVAATKAGELADTARDKTRAYLSSPEVKQDVEAARQAVYNATDPAKP